MAHTVWELRQISKLAQKKGLCTQVGMHGCAHDNFRNAVEYIRGGGIGEIREIHAWMNRTDWQKAPEIKERPQEAPPIPASLNWEAFLGPAGKRPFHPAYQPYQWRGWRDFGTGVLGNDGVHLLNLAAMGCQLGTPSKVKCLLKAPFHRETFSAWGTVCFDFLPRLQKGKVQLFWYEGRVGNLSRQLKGTPNFPGKPLFLGKSPSPQGCIIVGSKGSFHTSSRYGTDWEVNYGNGWIPSGNLDLPFPSMPRNGRGDSGMKEELVRAIRTNLPQIALANFEYAAEFTEWLLLGNIALSIGGEFDWDRENFSTNRSEANALLSKDYRNGWRVYAV